MTAEPHQRGTTSGATVLADATRIHHLSAGEGPPVVLLPGWSQTAAMFEPQIRHLSAHHRVLAIDHRGHGRSSTPVSGYHVHRLAADLREVLLAQDLTDVVLLGHSMGCAVIWAYLELYGSDGLSALVLVDQMPCALRNPGWSDETAADAGATMDATGLFSFTDALRGDGEDPRPAFIDQVTSSGITAEEVAWIVEENLRFGRAVAADLIFDVATHDWRPLLPHIDLPTLVIAGDSPNVPLSSQRWMASRLPDASLAEVPGRSGGTHFPFVERPREFNSAVSAFLEH